MPCIIKRFNLAYFPVAKNACTSLTRLFFEIENGFPYQNFAINGETIYLHTFYHSPLSAEEHLRRTEGMKRIAVVRDPIDRFISAYRNRVLYHGEIRNASFERHSIPLGTPHEPRLNEFAGYLDEYRKIPVIRGHTHPQVKWLGNDLSRFDHVYTFDRLPELLSMLRDLTGHNLTLPNAQRSDQRIQIDRLTPESLAILRKIYAPDYELLRGVYS